MVLRRVKVGQLCQRRTTPYTFHLKPNTFDLRSEVGGNNEKTSVLVGIGGNYHSGVALVPLVTGTSSVTKSLFATDEDIRDEPRSCL
jgi:hypothetical protein